MKEKEPKRISLATFIVTLLVMAAICVVLIYMIITENKKEDSETSKEGTNQVASSESTNQAVNNESEENADKVANSSNNSETNQTTVSNSNTSEVSAKDDFEISYKEEYYRVYNDAGEIVVENKRNIPTITSKNNQAVADKIVKALIEISDDEWNELIETSNEDDIKELQYTDLGVDWIISTEIIKTNTITFKFELSGGFGGVAWDDTSYFNYDLTTGEELSLKDIATNPTNLRNALDEKVIKDIESDSSITVIDGWKDAITETSELCWGFTEDGMEIVLPKYSIGPGSNGVIKITILEKEIDSYLKSEYK